MKSRVPPTPVSPGQASPRPPSSPGRWVLAAAVAVTALLVSSGFTTGEWRGVLVSEVQVIAVAAATYWGLT
ncbi:MAG TPA: hypothetical protein VEI94_12685 [Candidatus Bathyarchaeia archaeon]|nr:hypothetical protein [Candidatus Bathyarchaeia archaeon]